jgi:hypothetical protein
MALMNRKLQPGLETVFMMPAEKYSYLSSRLVREIAQLGGAIDCLVPPLVAQRLREKIDPAHKFSAGSERPAFADTPRLKASTAKASIVKASTGKPRKRKP